MGCFRTYKVYRCWAGEKCDRRDAWAVRLTIGGLGPKGLRGGTGAVSPCIPPAARPVEHTR